MIAGVKKVVNSGAAVTTMKDDEGDINDVVVDDVFGSVETGRHVSVMAYVRTLNNEHEKRRTSCGGGVRGTSSRSSSSSSSNGGSSATAEGFKGGEGRKGSLDIARIGPKVNLFAGSGDKLSAEEVFVEKLKRNGATADTKSSDQWESDNATKNNVHRDSLKSTHSSSPHLDIGGGDLIEPVKGGPECALAKCVPGKPKAGANVIINTVHFVTSQGRPASVDENKTFGATTPSRPIPNPRVRAAEGTNSRALREPSQLKLTDGSVFGYHCRVPDPTRDARKLVNVEAATKKCMSTNHTASKPSRVPLPVASRFFKIAPFESPSKDNTAASTHPLLSPTVATGVLMRQQSMPSPSVATGESDADNDNNIAASVGDEAAENGDDSEAADDTARQREKETARVGERISADACAGGEKVALAFDITSTKNISTTKNMRTTTATSVAIASGDGAVRNVVSASIDRTLSEELDVSAPALTREVVASSASTANSSERENDPFKHLVMADNIESPSVDAGVADTAADDATFAVMATSSSIKALEVIANDVACDIEETVTTECNTGEPPPSLSVNDIGSYSNGAILFLAPETSSACALISADVCCYSAAPIPFAGGPVSSSTTMADCWASTAIVGSHTSEAAACSAECNSSPCNTRPLPEPHGHLADVFHRTLLPESHVANVSYDTTLPGARPYVAGVSYDILLPESHMANDPYDIALTESHVAHDPYTIPLLEAQLHMPSASDVALVYTDTVGTDGRPRTVTSTDGNNVIAISTGAGTNVLDLSDGKLGFIETSRAVSVCIATPSEKLIFGAPEIFGVVINVPDPAAENLCDGVGIKSFGDGACYRTNVNDGANLDRINLESVRTDSTQAFLKSDYPIKTTSSSTVITDNLDYQTHNFDRETLPENSINVALDSKPCSDLSCEFSSPKKVSSSANCLEGRKSCGAHHDSRGAHHELRSLSNNQENDAGQKMEDEILEPLSNSSSDVVNHATRSEDLSTPHGNSNERNGSDDASRQTGTRIYDDDETLCQEKTVVCRENVNDESSLKVSDDFVRDGSGSSISENSFVRSNASINRKDGNSSRGNDASYEDEPSSIRSKSFECSSSKRESPSGPKSFEGEGSYKRGSGSGNGEVPLQGESSSFGGSDRDGSPYQKDNPKGRSYAEQHYGEFVSQLKGRRNNPLMASSTSIASSTWYIDLAMSSSVGGGDDSDGSLASSRAPSVASIAPDKYGFIGGAQYTADGEENIPVHVIRKRESKWLEMLNHWDAFMMKKYDKVRDRCRKGIPSAIRARAWQHLCGADRVLENNPGVFDRLAAAPLDPRTEDEIRKDLHRQFPRHEMFLRRGGQGQEDLFQVLKVHSLVCGDGYCQAHAPVAAVLLMQMPAEHAFWCLRAICDKYVPGYYSHGLEAIQVDGVILFKLLKKVSPSVYKLLKKQKIDPVLYMTEWFMCLFSRSLPWASVLRVWDMFFCEGVKVLFRVGLVMLKFGLRAEVRAQCPSMYESLQALRNMAPGIVAEDFLLIQLQRLDISEDDLQKEHMRQITKRDQDKLQAEKEREQKQKARER